MPTFIAKFSDGKTERRFSSNRNYSHAYQLKGEGRAFIGFASSSMKAERHARGDNTRSFGGNAVVEIVETTKA